MSARDEQATFRGRRRPPPIDQAPGLLLARRRRRACRRKDIGPVSEVCARHRQRAAAAPSSPTWHYLAVRCLEDGTAQHTQFFELAERWPDHGWILAAGGAAALDRGDYHRAVTWLEAARTRLSELSDTIAERLARARRLDQSKELSVRALAGDSPLLQIVAAV